MEEGLDDLMRSYSLNVFLTAKSKVQKNIYVCYFLCKNKDKKHTHTHIYANTLVCTKRNTGKTNKKFMRLVLYEGVGKLDGKGGGKGTWRSGRRESTEMEGNWVVTLLSTPFKK